MNGAMALLLGFLGSFHCVGMCGPIALALPLNRSTRFTKIIGAVLYNFGRVVTYSLLGLLFGLLGKGFVIADYQQFLSIATGSIILILLFTGKINNSKNVFSPLFGFVSKVKEQLRNQFKKSSNTSLFFIGTLNGLLPCGLVYLGVAGAIATGDGLQGSLFMSLFGLGTIPAMITLSLISDFITLNFRNKMRRVMPVFIVSMALLLILRGMNLGIPYVSPKMSTTEAKCHKCCKE
jgi:sulfite exporter TauE/SafE